MEKLLEGKVALVTGGSRGIGKAIVETFALEGAKVVFNSRIAPDLDSMMPGEKIAYQLVRRHNQITFIEADISDPETGQRLVDETIKLYGHLDILVNNAGIKSDGFFVRMNDEDWNSVLQTNLYGTMYTTRAALKEMMKLKSGSIISISSIVAHGNPGQANYSASKAGIEGLMKTVALEYAGRGIRANAIEGGPVETDMLNSLTPEQKQMLINLTPLRRAITPQEIANTVLFLASNLSSAITGQVINVDGGMIR